MKHLKILFVVLCLIFLNPNILFSQTVKYKFGEVSKDELKMKYYDKDSTANAVILYDKGYSYFNFSVGLKLIYKRHLRFKVLNKNGLGYANFEIPLFKVNGAGEDIYTVKAKVFNIEGDKVDIIKLTKDNYFIEETSEVNETVKVAFPGVKVGSVIDFVYEIGSDFLFSLRSWTFQYKIPVVYSEYTVEMPDIIQYHIDVRGFDDVFISKKSDYRYNGYNGNIRSNYITWTAKEIPAFKEEPYLTTYKDYVSSIIFELASIQVPGRIYQNFSVTWKNVDERLLKNPYFGEKLNVSSSIKKLGNEIAGNFEKKYDKMIKLYTYVQNNFEWNKYNKNKYSYLGFNKLKKEKEGNNADINFLLLRLLRSQQISANPVILSTRDHGLIFPTHPTSYGYNYVIVEAKIDDKIYFLDATSKKTPAGMLPKRCLNGEGRVIIPGQSKKIDISPSEKYSTSKIYSLKIIQGKGLSGSVNNNYKGYSALEKRNDIEKTGGVKEYIKAFEKESFFEEIDNHIFENTEDFYKPLNEKFECTIVDNITFSGDKIYLTPLLNEKKEDNPFKLNERKYPVDYAFSYDERLIFQYTIPEGYEIIEVPEKTAFTLPGRSAQFQFQTSVVGNMVQVISIFKINNPVFYYDSYKALKKFYDLVIAKQNEKIVFKKKE